MRLAILTAALVALLPASAHGADLVVDGHGWGHGVGMSQYGAYGYALREGRDAKFILAHYYTGSTYGTAPAARMRVRLKRNRVQRISGATRGAGRQRPERPARRDAHLPLPADARPTSSRSSTPPTATRAPSSSRR